MGETQKDKGSPDLSRIGASKGVACVGFSSSDVPASGPGKLADVLLYRKGRGLRRGSICRGGDTLEVRCHLESGGPASVLP